MSDLAPILLAGLGGGAIAIAIGELARSVPAIGAYLGSARTALSRAGDEGRPPTASERHRLAVVASAGLGVLALGAFGPGIASGAAVLGPAAAGWIVDRRHRSYRRRVEAEIPAIANALADALAAGGSLRTALAGAPSAVVGAAAVELARVRADLAIGLSPATAMASLRERLGSEEVGALAAAILSQQRSGGDLAGLLRSHAAAAEGRARAAKQARAATAQARMTGGMVVAMPVGAALLIELAVPGFVGSMLAEPVAAAMLAAALGLQLLGYAWIQRLGRVRG